MGSPDSGLTPNGRLSTPGWLRGLPAGIMGEATAPGISPSSAKPRPPGPGVAGTVWAQHWDSERWPIPTRSMAPRCCLTAPGPVLTRPEPHPMPGPTERPRLGLIRGRTQPAGRISSWAPMQTDISAGLREFSWASLLPTVFLSFWSIPDPGRWASYTPGGVGPWPEFWRRAWAACGETWGSIRRISVCTSARPSAGTVLKWVLRFTGSWGCRIPLGPGRWIFEATWPGAGRLRGSIRTESPSRRGALCATGPRSFLTGEVRGGGRWDFWESGPPEFPAPPGGARAGDFQGTGKEGALHSLPLGPVHKESQGFGVPPLQEIR